MHNPAPQDWNVYFCRLDGQPASFRINLGLAETEPAAAYSQHIRISIRLKHPSENGFPTPEESEAVYNIEDQLDVLHPSDNISAGTVTSDGSVSWHFYSRNSEAFIRDCRNLAEESGYSFDIQYDEDPSWSSYHNFLYPDIYQLQSIRNNQVVRHFQEDGDQTGKIRPIEHWLFFNSQENMDAATVKAKQAGYTVVSSGKTDEAEGSPNYHLQLSKDGTLDHITQDTWDLIDIAQATGGDYDGWGAALAK